MTENNKPILESASFEFSQDGNCADGGYESLVIRCESSLGIDRDKGCFYILKTEQWAINEPEELVALLDKVKQAIDVVR
jgi:hypothetical protein